MPSSKKSRSARVRVRTVHSQASTGATVFSRVLAALPGVVLLNEVCPNGHRTAQNRFNALDPLEQMHVRYPGMVLSAEQYRDLFVARLRPVLDYCQAGDLTLIIRDHPHSDYMAGTPDGPSLLGALALLEDEIELKSMVMVRYPLSSYMTAKESHFLDYIPHFQNYCSRYLQFMADYVDVPVQRYENFVREPEAQLQKICDLLGLEFSARALRGFAAIHLAGNSGRYGGDRMVHPVLMRDFGEALRTIARSAPAAQKLCGQLSYPVDPVVYAQHAAEAVLKFNPNDADAESAHGKWSGVLVGTHDLEQKPELEDTPDD